jgi:hypothetical protein
MVLQSNQGKMSLEQLKKNIRDELADKKVNKKTQTVVDKEALEADREALGLWFYRCDRGPALGHTTWRSMAPEGTPVPIWHASPGRGARAVQGAVEVWLYVPVSIDHVKREVHYNGMKVADIDAEQALAMQTKVSAKYPLTIVAKSV